MDNKEIIIKDPKMKRLVEWLEKRSLPVRALIVTAAIFGLIITLYTFGVLIFWWVGADGLLLFIGFIVMYIYILTNMR